MSEPAAGSAELPVFSRDQLDHLRPYGIVRQVKTGDVLFSPADDSYDLIFVLRGEIEIGEQSQGRHVPVICHKAGQFAGELSLLTGQRPFHTARAMTDGEVLQVTPAQLRDMLTRETELAEVLVRALIARRRQRVSGEAIAATEIIGTGQSAQALALRSFLSRNMIDYRWIDLDEADDPGRVLGGVPASRDDLPVAITPTRVLTQASPAALADVLGLGYRPEDGRLFDVVIVGAGPAGLAAAVYGASEGLDVAVLDATAPGGQAGTTSRIENYLGFPEGLSGTELTTRATVQAQRFGALLASPCRVEGLTVAGTVFAVLPAVGTAVLGRTVVAATGAVYRRLQVPGWRRLECTGIFYSATDLEAELCAGRAVVVLGGGNSTGQAALYLARRCPNVTIVTRGDTLGAAMSQYLADRVLAHPRIEVATSTIVQAVDGRDHLESVTLRDTRTGTTRQLAAGGLFCFIGAQPASGWLPEDVTRDEDGFVRTDAAIPPGRGARRPRLPYETAVDGVFAAGDIRVGSMKRVAAAVGEGSSVIRSVHQYLAAYSDRDPAAIPASTS
jgi:thioredoxin reductase (NADPH)